MRCLSESSLAYKAVVFILNNKVNWFLARLRSIQMQKVGVKVARYSLSGSIPPKFERKLRRHKQRFGKINTTVVLDKDENLLRSGLQ